MPHSGSSRFGLTLPSEILISSSFSMRTGGSQLPDVASPVLTIVAAIRVSPGAGLVVQSATYVALLRQGYHANLVLASLTPQIAVLLK